MIEATVMRTVWNDGKTGYEVKAKGHAGAGKYGQDIVCAAVSCLMQTLANEVEEAARAGLVALGAVAHGEGWMRVEVTPTHESCDMVEAWVELVQDGLDALAESYPENVELVVNMVFADGKAPDPAQLPDMVDGKMNLQLFAATEATTASGRNREPRLGPWPAGHECRPRHEVGATTRLAVWICSCLQKAAETAVLLAMGRKQPRRCRPRSCAPHRSGWQSAADRAER